MTLGVVAASGPVSLLWLGYPRFDPARKKPVPPRPTAIQVSADLLARYAGTNRYESGDAVTYIKADGVRLYASDDGQSWDELLARSGTVFFPQGRTVSITFITDTAGIVTGFVADTGSGKTAARRVR